MARGMIRQRPGRLARGPKKPKNPRPRDAETTPDAGIRTETQLRYTLSQHSKFLGSQKRLAKRLGVKPAYLNDVIRGRRPVSDKIALALGYARVVRFYRLEGEGFEEDI